MKDARLKNKSWRERTGFDNIMTVAELLAELPKDRQYAIMYRLDDLDLSYYGEKKD